MKSISGLPVVNSEPQSQTIPLTELNALTDSASIPPVDQSELNVTTTFSSLLVDKGELLSNKTPVEPITASSSLVEASEPHKVEDDISDVQVAQKSASSSKVDESRPAETTTVSSPQVDNSESLEVMRGSATVDITITEMVESDNSLPEQTLNSSPSIEQSELLSEFPPDNSSPVAQSEPLLDTTPPEPREASDTPATKRKSQPRSQSVSEPLRRKTRRRAK